MTTAQNTLFFGDLHHLGKLHRPNEGHRRKNGSFKDADSDEQKFTFAGNNPVVALRNPINPGDNSLRTHDFSSVTPTNSSFDFGDVKQLIVKLTGSGAIS